MVNYSTYRHEFYNMYQEQGETIDDMAHKCNFKVICVAATTIAAAVVHDLVDEFVRDELLVGLLDQTIRARLMREKNLR